MHPDLEAAVAADEECRSRLTLAETRREREVAAARGRATIEGMEEEERDEFTRRDVWRRRTNIAM